ncbi:MAG TPA: sigma-70 family RNA polymerase sigma factor [Streptosporangiaceae bacterium]|nr:sigma-70 family RNA polymerase sigma factor [Streptosporangiaceae bacterium]
MTAATDPGQVPDMAAAPLSPCGASPEPVSAGAVVQELYAAHALTLIRLANLLVRDRADAEDVVQDAFTALYRALPRLRDHDQLLPYLRAAVINGCRSALRGRRRAAQLAARDWPAEPPAAASAEASVLLREERRTVFAAMSRLPRRSREVLALRYYLDLTDSEISETLGVSRGTVSSTASRAVAALTREFRSDHDVD